MVLSAWRVAGEDDLDSLLEFGRENALVLEIASRLNLNVIPTVLCVAVSFYHCSCTFAFRWGAISGTCHSQSCSQREIYNQSSDQTWGERQVQVGRR